MLTLSFDKTFARVLLYGALPVTAECPMPINRLLAKTAFDAEETAEIIHAYESVLAFLNLTDRNDPATEMVASQVLRCAGEGEVHRRRLYDCVLAAIRK
jgi:hypothetical protein